MKLVNISKSVFAGLLISLFILTPVSAHVVVKPSEVSTGTYTTFTVSVPNEREVDTVEVKLDIPESIGSVTPTVKQGWQISTVSPAAEIEEDGHSSEKVDSITWSGGAIPKGQRDDFSFSAKTPDETGDINWKAYQVYADGVTVSWDKTSQEQPKKEDGSPDYSNSGPLSITKVVSSEEAAAEADSSQSAESDVELTARRATYIAICAVVVALIALVIATTQKKK